MSQANVEIVRRYFDAIIRMVDTHAENPCSFVGALEAEDRDADARRVLDQLHPEVRWRNLLGVVFEGKLDCARAVDELMGASRYYSVTLDTWSSLGTIEYSPSRRWGCEARTAQSPRRCRCSR